MKAEEWLKSQYTKEQVNQWDAKSLNVICEAMEKYAQFQLVKVEEGLSELINVYEKVKPLFSHEKQAIEKAKKLLTTKQ